MGLVGGSLAHSLIIGYELLFFFLSLRCISKLAVTKAEGPWLNCAVAQDQTFSSEEGGETITNKIS